MSPRSFDLRACAGTIVDNHGLAESFEGADPAPGTPDQFGAFIKSEIVRWAKVIKASGATPQ